MDSVSAANATAKAASTAATSGTSTSATTKTDDAKSFATLFAEAKGDLKKGEKLSKVDGHDYGRIKGGTRDDMCVNLSGNARSGQAFDLIWRDGRQFHVYGGSGADHKVVEVGKKAADTTKTAATTGGTDATSTTGTTTSGSDSTAASNVSTTADTTSSTGTSTSSDAAAAGSS
jgi:hypothetical protein